MNSTLISAYWRASPCPPVIDGMSVFIIARFVYNFPVVIERCWFSDGCGPNLWGFWNMLYVGSTLRHSPLASTAHARFSAGAGRTHGREGPDIGRDTNASFDLTSFRSCCCLPCLEALVGSSLTTLGVGDLNGRASKRPHSTIRQSSFRLTKPVPISIFFVKPVVKKAVDLLITPGERVWM